MLAGISQPFLEVWGAFWPSVRSIAPAVPRTVGAIDKTPVKNVFFLWEMLSIFRHLMKNEHGATAIEYTLIPSLIAVAAIAAMGSVGKKVTGALSNVASAMG